jgi:hypothetical protein
MTPDLRIRYNAGMHQASAFTKAQNTILRDAIQRDLTTARRAMLLEILWQERYLTRAQLMARVEQRVGKNCFGASAWEDTFYRDMYVVKQAFKAAGFILAYSRNKQLSGYYLEGQPALSPELQHILQSSIAEVDSRQIEIYQRLTPADRFRQGCSISDTARQVVAFRIRKENPKMSIQEANRLALQRAYQS